MIDIAVVLCAGGGTRLRPLTDDRPKALMDVGGETILHRAVRLLAAAGVRKLVIATGYRQEALRAALASAPVEVAYCHNPDFERTQNSVSLRLCAPALAGRGFFKLDGDVVFDPRIVTRLAADGASLSAAVDRRASLGDEEMKVITEGSAIRAFGKGLDPALSAGESIGIEKLSAPFGAELFGALDRAGAEGRLGLYYEDVYGELVARGHDAHAVDVSDLAWTEIDTPDDLARAQAWVAEGRFDRHA